MKLEATVFAIRAAWTCPGAALSGYHSIDAVIPAVERLMLVTVFPGHTSLARAYQCFRFCVSQHVTFPLKVFVLLNWCELSQGVRKQSKSFRMKLELILSLQLSKYVILFDSRKY